VTAAYTFWWEQEFRAEELTASQQREKQKGGFEAIYKSRIIG